MTHVPEVPHRRPPRGRVHAHRQDTRAQVDRLHKSEKCNVSLEVILVVVVRAVEKNFPHVENPPASTRGVQARDLGAKDHPDAAGAPRDSLASLRRICDAVARREHHKLLRRVGFDERTPTSVLKLTIRTYGVYENGGMPRPLSLVRDDTFDDEGSLGGGTGQPAIDCAGDGVESVEASDPFALQAARERSLIFTLSTLPTHVKWRVTGVSGHRSGGHGAPAPILVVAADRLHLGGGGDVWE